MKITATLALVCLAGIAFAQTPTSKQSPQAIMDRSDITLEQAEKDIQKNRFRFYSVGLVSMQHSEVAKILKRDYGIELSMAAGCVVSNSLVARVRAYNERMEKAVLKKFGKPYSQIYDEARHKIPPKPTAPPQSH